jgi:hypothetical protein
MFKQSTQNKNWLFEKQEQLDKLQITKFERGLKIIAELNKDLQPPEVTSSQPEVGKDSKMQIPQQKISVNLKSSLIILIINRNNPTIRRERVYYILHKSDKADHYQKNSIKESQILRDVFF